MIILGYVPPVKTGRPTLPAEEAARVRAKIAELLAKDPATGRPQSQTALAKKIGFTQPALSQLLPGKDENGATVPPRNRASFETACGVARVAGVPVMVLLGRTDAEPETTALDERYPWRAKAARAAGFGPYLAEAIEAVLHRRYEMSEDPGFDFWMDEIKAEDRRLRFRAKDPTEADREDEKAESDADVLVERTRPRLPKKRAKKSSA